MNAPFRLAERDLVVERHFRAPPSAVLAAWTDPAALARWWGPTTSVGPEVVTEAAPGGASRLVVRGPDGIDTTVTFDAIDGGTLVRVLQRFESAADAANAEAGAAIGWSQRGDRLAVLLATTHPAEDTLVLTRTFAAPRPAVFAAWSSAAALDAWFGPDGFVTTTKEFAFEPGGLWRFTMAHPEYGTFPNRVRWKQIIAPERLSYDHDDDGEDKIAFAVEVWFEDTLDGGTRLTLVQVHPDAAARARAESFGAVASGYQTLARLAAWVGAHLAALAGRRAHVEAPPRRRPAREAAE